MGICRAESPRNFEPGGRYNRSEHRTFERGHWIWKQVRNRANHYFDCEAMQVAVATMLKLVGQESVKDAE